MRALQASVFVLAASSLNLATVALLFARPFRAAAVVCLFCLLAFASAFFTCASV